MPVSLAPILDRARSHWMAVPALLFPHRQRLMALRGRPRLLLLAQQLRLPVHTDGAWGGRLRFRPGLRSKHSAEPNPQKPKSSRLLPQEQRGSRLEEAKLPQNQEVPVDPKKPTACSPHQLLQHPTLLPCHLQQWKRRRDPPHWLQVQQQELDSRTHSRHAHSRHPWTTSLWNRKQPNLRSSSPAKTSWLILACVPLRSPSSDVFVSVVVWTTSRTHPEPRFPSSVAGNGHSSTSHSPPTDPPGCHLLLWNGLPQLGIFPGAFRRGT